MHLNRISAPDGPQPSGGYAQATEVTDFERIVYISGQIPVDSKGAVPSTFGEQCQTVWDNLEAQLREAGLSVENIIKVTTFLSAREYAEENSAVRRERLDGVEPSLTVIITDIYDSDWLLEIEAIAAD